MNKTELEAIRQRTDAATPGPWTMKQDGADFYMADSQGRYLDITLADAIFAAHSRQDIPALLDEVRRLMADNAKQKAENAADQYSLSECINGADLIGEDFKRLEADNARLRAAISESIADVKGAQFTDNTWKEAEAEKRGILAGLENALKGGG